MTGIGLPMRADRRPCGARPGVLQSIAMAKTKSPKPPAGADTEGGGALGRARQFARSRGLPMPEVDAAAPAKATPAKKKPAARKKAARPAPR